MDKKTEERLNYILETSTHQKTIEFVSGLKEYHSKKGSLTPNQMNALENTEMRMKLKKKMKPKATKVEELVKPQNGRCKTIEERLTSIEDLLALLVDRLEK